MWTTTEAVLKRCDGRESLTLASPVSCRIDAVQVSSGLTYSPYQRGADAIAQVRPLARAGIRYLRWRLNDRQPRGRRSTLAVQPRRPKHRVVSGTTNALITLLMHACTLTHWALRDETARVGGVSSNYGQRDKAYARPLSGTQKTHARMSSPPISKPYYNIRKAKKASLYRFPKTRKAHYALYALYAILLTSGCSPASIRSVGVFFCDAFLCSFHSDIISSLTPLLHANKA